MEVGERMTMKIFLMIIFLVGCDIVAVGDLRGLDIQNGVLLSWPRDFKGVAVVPSEVRHVGSGAFSGCKELTAVAFTESIETVGPFAFSGCERLRDVQIPASVTNIGRSVFLDCQILTNVVIHARIRKVPGNMCSCCYSLRHVQLPDGIVEIGDMAFRGCRSLQTIDIPSSAKRICRGAFVGCSRLSRVEFPRGIELVDEFAFYGCFDLKALVFQSVSLKFGSDAFRDCYNLKGCVFSDAPRNNLLYSLPPDCEVTTESICRKECFVGSYETVEKALSNDWFNKSKLDRGLFEGLEQVLRIAADGMVEEMPNRYYPVGKMDALAANLFKLSERDGVQKIKDFFKHYSSPSVDMGTELVANLCIQSDIAISVEFHDEKLVKLTLSDGLKDVIRRKLMKGNAVADERMLKWLGTSPGSTPSYVPLIGGLGAR